MKLGILGAGQLARMLALAAYPLGIRTVCLDPNVEVCAKQVTEVVTADFSDLVGVKDFLTQVDCVTIETENIPLACAEFIQATTELLPSATALRITQDRLLEKNFVRSLGIPTADFYAINEKSDLELATKLVGFPCLLKTRRCGYDGKGQFLLKNSADIPVALKLLNPQGLILERFIAFESEYSLISVRNKAGEVVFYPLIQNKHKAGILYSSEMVMTPLALQAQAESSAQSLLTALNYVGVFTIEFFYNKGVLLINELAPRVHNSGHLTIEGVQTSQFENHLRALFNLPLGRVAPLGYCFLVNCVGRLPALATVLKIPGVHYHQYGKTAQAGRKLGHLTLVDPLKERYQASRELLLALL